MPASGPPPAAPSARLAARVALLAATLVSILAILAIWADRQLLNPTNWSNTSTALLRKPTVRDAVATFLTDQIYAHVDVSQEIGKGLPKGLKPLAGPISGALRSAAESAAADLLAQPRVQNAWKRANYVADQQLIRAADNRSGLRLEEETVALDLRPIATDLARRLGISDVTVADRLPPNLATFKILHWSDVGLVRDTAKALRPLALTLISLAVLLYALAFAVTRGRRRRTLMSIGVSLVLAGLVTLAARKIAQPQVISALTKDASIEPAANDAYSVATSLLVQAATSPIVIGVPFVLAAWFAGPASMACALRRFLAPHLRVHPGAVYWLTSALLALIFAWGPIPATRNPFEMACFTLLALLGAHALRRQLDAEFPAGSRVSLRAVLTAQLRELADKAAQVLASVARAGDAASQRSIASELERLAALHESRALTDDEFARAKQEILQPRARPT